MNGRAHHAATAQCRCPRLQRGTLPDGLPEVPRRADRHRPRSGDGRRRVHRRERGPGRRVRRRGRPLPAGQPGERRAGARPQHRRPQLRPGEPLPRVRRQRRHRPAAGVRTAGRRPGGDGLGSRVRQRAAAADRRQAPAVAHVPGADGDHTAAHPHLPRPGTHRRPDRLQQGLPPLLLGRAPVRLPRRRAVRGHPDRAPRALPGRLRRHREGPRLPLA